jgi:hypothetical protein
METAIEPNCIIVRRLPDGHQVFVGAFQDVHQAQEIIDELSKYWPGDYAIVRRHSDDGVVR